MKSYQSASQPFSVRFVIFLNVIFWNINIPLFGVTFSANVLLTIIVGLFACLSGSIASARSLLFLSLFILYGAVAYLIGPCTDGEVKAFASLIALVLVLISLRRLAHAIRWDKPIISVKEVYVMLCLASLGVMVEFVFKFLSGMPFNELRVGGFYQEPSHLALSVSPLIFFLWLSGHRLSSIVLTIVFIIFSFSSTLIIMLAILVGLLIAGQTLRRKSSSSDLLMLLVLISVMIASIMLSSSSDILMRINDLIDIREDSNLSSLVYANGWQQLHSYLTSTSGIGLGVNSMGCSPHAQTPITNWLKLIDLPEQNFNDGSFLFSKLGSEFGLVGILLFSALLIYTTKRLMSLSFNSSPSEIIFFAWLAVITFGGLVRSAGYFTGPVIIGIFAFYALQHQGARSRCRAIS